MARLARLCELHGDRPALRVKVLAPQARKLAVAATRQERSTHEVAKASIGGVDEPNAFVIRQETLNWRVSLFERLHFAPCVRARDTAVLIGAVQRGLEDSQCPVGRRPARPRGVAVLGIDRRRLAIFPEARSARELWRGCKSRVPVANALRRQLGYVRLA